MKTKDLNYLRMVKREKSYINSTSELLTQDKPLIVTLKLIDIKVGGCCRAANANKRTCKEKIRAKTNFG